MTQCSSWSPRLCLSWTGKAVSVCLHPEALALICIPPSLVGALHWHCCLMVSSLKHARPEVRYACLSQQCTEIVAEGRREERTGGRGAEGVARSGELHPSTPSMAVPCSPSDPGPKGRGCPASCLVEDLPCTQSLLSLPASCTCAQPREKGAFMFCREVYVTR